MSYNRIAYTPGRPLLKSMLPGSVVFGHLFLLCGLNTHHCITRIFARGPSDRPKNAGQLRQPRLGRFVEGS